MSAAAHTPVPTSSKSTTAPPARICKTPGCGKILAYNNVTGVCGECLAKKTKGILDAKRAPAAAAPAKHNGARHHDPAHSNGKSNGNGNGATPDPMRLLVMTRDVSRIDLLIQAIPIEDKTKMLSAWIAGKF